MEMQKLDTVSLYTRTEYSTCIRQISNILLPIVTTLISYDPLVTSKGLLVSKPERKREIEREKVVATKP